MRNTESIGLTHSECRNCQGQRQHHDCLGYCLRIKFVLVVIVSFFVFLPSGNTIPVPPFGRSFLFQLMIGLERLPGYPALRVQN